MQDVANVPQPSTAIAGRRMWSKQVVLFTLAALLYWAAQFVYVPILPTYAQTKTSDLAIIGVMLGQYGLWQAIVRLPLGIAADWLGRRVPFVAVGIALAAVGAWLMGAGTSIDQIAVGRAITGLAAGSWVLLVVIFSALFPPEQAVRASAQLTVVASVGRILATALAGPLTQIGGYALPFFVATGAGLLGALLVLGIEEPRLPRRKSSPAQLSHLLLRRDVLVPSLFAVVVQYFNWGVTYSFMPLRVKQLGAGELLVNSFVLISILTYLVGNIVAARPRSRRGTFQLTRIGYATIFAGIASAAIVNSVPLLIVSQLLLGIGHGIVYPVLMGLCIRDVDGTERATALGLHQAVYALGMFAGPWLCGVLASTMGIPAMLAVSAVGCALLGMVGLAALARSAPLD